MTVSVFYNGVIVHQLQAKIEHYTFSNPILPPFIYCMQKGDTF